MYIQIVNYTTFNCKVEFSKVPLIIQIPFNFTISMSLNVIIRIPNQYFWNTTKIQKYKNTKKTVFT